MSNEDSGTDKQALDKIVERELKSGILNIYEDLLMTVWAKILPTLGTVTVVTIIQRAISRTSPNHPSLNNLSVSEAGVSFAKLRETVGDETTDELKNGFKELIANFFDILAKLTGNIIVKQLIKEVDGLDVAQKEK